VKALGKIIKNKRVVLTGDFNSTETKSFYDTGGPLPPTNAKNKNTATIHLRLQRPGYPETMRLGSWRD
jgi:hypothetical protein